MSRCNTEGCQYGVFRGGLCAPCWGRAEHEREHGRVDLARRKAEAFDAIERIIADGASGVKHSKPGWIEDEPWDVEVTHAGAKRWFTAPSLLEAVEKAARES